MHIKLISDFVFLTGCALGLDDKRGILIGGHYVVDGFISDLGQTIPTNIKINNQVLEVDIEDKSNWNVSKVPLKKVWILFIEKCVILKTNNLF